MDYEGADAMVEDPSQASEKASPSSKQSAVKEEEDKEIDNKNALGPFVSTIL